MWEKFKDWVASDNFVWCMFGWQLNELLTRPTLLNLALMAFWIWVLATNQE